eukprot:6201103-Pyramimonas_sp.AAC.1
MMRCLIASLAIALWAGSCSFLVVMPRQLSSALLASGTVPLTPTVITCIVSTTFHPALLSYDWLSRSPAGIEKHLLHTSAQDGLLYVGELENNKVVHKMDHLVRIKSLIRPFTSEKINSASNLLRGGAGQRNWKMFIRKWNLRKS